MPAATYVKTKSDGGKHTLRGKMLRMIDPLWDHLEAKKRRTGRSVQSLLRELVRHDMEVEARDRHRRNSA